MRSDLPPDEMRKDISTNELLTSYIEPYLEYIAYELGHIAKRRAEHFAKYRNAGAPPTDLYEILSDLHKQRISVGKAARDATRLTPEEAAKRAHAKDILRRGGFTAWFTGAEKEIRKIDAALKKRASLAEKTALMKFDRRKINPILDNATRYEKYIMLRDGYAERAKELQKAQARFKDFVDRGATAAARIGITHYSVGAPVVLPTPRPKLSKIERILRHHEYHAYLFPQRESLKAFLKTGGATPVPLSDPPVIHSVKGNRPYNLHDELSSLLNRLASQVDVHQDLYTKLKANPVAAPDKNVLDEKITALEIQRKKELIDAKRNNRITADYQKYLDTLRERTRAGNGIQRFYAGCELKYQEMRNHPNAALVDAIIVNATDEICTDETYQKAVAEIINEDVAHKAKYAAWTQEVHETQEKKRRVAAVRDELSKLIQDTNALFHYGIEFKCAPSNVSDEDLVAHAQALMREFATSITSEREELNFHLHTAYPLNRPPRLSLP